jgi:predicted ester cyclase
MVMVTMTGTNSGPMMGKPGSNKQFKVQGSDILIIKDGKASERWGFSEEMKMMGQLGAMPGPEAQADTTKMMNAQKK